MNEIEGEGLLSRWSRRKLETSEQTQSDNSLLEIEKPEQLPVAAEAIKATEPDVNEEPVLTDEDMPPIETLGEDSDFSMFMSSGVSDKLRNLALRKMFHVPAFNIRDGLDEYDEDYTFFEPLGDILTCDMKHQIEMREKKKQEEAEALALEEEGAIENEDEKVEEQELIENDAPDKANLEASASEATESPEIFEAEN